MLAAPGALLPWALLLLLLGGLARGRGGAGWLARPSPLDVGWLALLAGSLLGALVSPNGPAAAGRLAAVVASLALFFWLRTELRSPARLRGAGWALVVASLLGALAILALIRGQLPDSLLTRRLSPLLGLFSAFPGVSGDVLDVNSRFPVHQYGLAYLLLMMTPFLAAEAALGAGRGRRLLAGLGALACATLLAATETRGALLALALAVALVASLRSRWFWGLLPLGGLALYLLLARGIISRSIEAEWLNTRLSIWTRSLNLLADFPLTGAGLGMQTFAEVFAWNFGLPNPYLVVHSHNIFIQAYAEQGLLGLVGLILALGAGLLLAWRAARAARPEARVVSAGVFGALAGSLLYGLTDQVPTTNYGLVVLAALCALGVAGARERGSAGVRERASAGSISRSRAPALSRSLTPAIAVTLLLLAVAPRWVSGLALNVGAAELTRAALDRALDTEQKALALSRAEAALGTAVSWNPRNSAAYRELARVRLLAHDVPGALAALDLARATGNLNDYERTQLGRLYLELGFWDEAFELWKAAGQSERLSQAADDLAARHDLKGAVAAHATLVELQPSNPEHYANLAKALLAGPTPSVDAAMGWFERAAELNPDARRSLARQLVLEAEDFRTNERRCGGRFDRAVFWFSLASRVDPSFDKPEVELGAVRYYAGHCAEAAGRGPDASALYTAAAGHFRTAAALDPKNGSTWHQLGQAEEAAGRQPAAIAAFEQAVRVAPTRAGLHASLGRVYLEVGQCQAARSELAEALRLEPGNQLALSESARLGECG